MAQRRRAERVRFKTSIYVGFVIGNDRFSALLEEFNPFGLVVKTSREVKPGTVLRLGIKIETDYLRAAAVVRRKFSDGFAVEFLSMGSMDREILRRIYLRLQLADRPSGPS